MAARRALLVACDNFQDAAFEALTYPRADAERLSAALLDPTLCYFDHVDVLANPTQSEVRRAVFRMTSAAAHDDLVLLYYSGHGALDRDGSLALILPDTESDGLGGSALVADEIRRAFNQSRAAQKVLILDCCHAGAVGSDKMKGAPTEGLGSIAEPGSGTYILAASTRFQPAFERSELGGGVLTSCLLRGIVNGEAAPNAEEVTLSGLASYVKAEARKHGAQPQYWDLGSKDEVVLARRPVLYDAAWRARVSQALATYYAENEIDYELHEEIGAAIAAPVNEASRPAKQLIDQLVRKRISLMRFGSSWATLQGHLAPAGRAPPDEAVLPLPKRPAPEPPPPSKPEFVAPAAETPRPLTDGPGPSQAKPGDLWVSIVGRDLTSAAARFAPPWSLGAVSVLAALATNGINYSQRDGFLATAMSVGFASAMWLALRLAFSPPAGSPGGRAATVVFALLFAGSAFAAAAFFANLTSRGAPSFLPLMFGSAALLGAITLVAVIRRIPGALRPVG